MFVIPLGNRLKDLREEKGLTQHQLSCIAGLPGNAIFRIENQCVKKTSILRAKAIADALGCPVEDMFVTPGHENIEKGA